MSSNISRICARGIKFGFRGPQRNQPRAQLAQESARLAAGGCLRRDDEGRRAVRHACGMLHAMRAWDVVCQVASAKWHVARQV